MISYDVQGIWWSLLLVVLLFFSLHRKWLPSFVMPASRLNQTKIWLHRVWLGLMMLCIVLLPLNIQIEEGSKEIEKSTSYVQVLFDVSLSMAADDIVPSRFEVAKISLIQALDTLEDALISVINFSGVPIVSVPFSSHIQAIQEHLATMRLTDFPPTIDFVGTALGDALLVTIDNITQKTQDPAVLLLITDGDTSTGNNPLDVAKLAKEKGISIFAFAVGVDDFIIGYDKNENAIHAYLDTDLLQQIVDETGGKLFRILDADEMSDALDEVKLILDQSTKFILVSSMTSLNKILSMILLILVLGYGAMKVIILGRVKKVVG